MPTSSEYGGMGILEAVDKLFAEEGDGKSTSEIADIIRDRGVFSKSKDFVTSLYASLYNASDGEGARTENPRFTRRDDKWFWLKKKGMK